MLEQHAQTEPYSTRYIFNGKDDQVSKKCPVYIFNEWVSWCVGLETGIYYYDARIIAVLKAAEVTPSEYSELLRAENSQSKRSFEKRAF